MSRSPAAEHGGTATTPGPATAPGKQGLPPGGTLYPESVRSTGDAVLWLERSGASTVLQITAPDGSVVLRRFDGDERRFGTHSVLKLCRTDVDNARALREVLPNLRPMPLGLATTVGFGDRLGLATPGHARALSAVRTMDRPIFPIFAQQSIREMRRTDRSPDIVLADATWGAFAAGWTGAVGADADHLKSLEDVDAAVAAGYSFFTFDPSDHVDNRVENYSDAVLRDRFLAIPWSELESSPAEMQGRYSDRTVALERGTIALDSHTVMRAAVKYGSALVHVTALYRRLASSGVPFEVEVSVDETETPTTHREHVFLAVELARLGVQWVSLAPRFVGRFEKGINYIGNLDAFGRDIEGHAEIARALGPYKLGLHSGSDKLSVYPIAMRATDGLLHLKTAGTSYLEALRVTAGADAALFRDIMWLAVERYETDRATYHVSAEIDRLPALDSMPDASLPCLLDDPNARQILHVTFGSVLARHRERLLAVLAGHEDRYISVLLRHFGTHLDALLSGSERTEAHS